MRKHVKLDEKYYLITQEVNTTTVAEVAKNVNHLIVVDVSGSMYYDLPIICKNLKNKISSLVRENDTVSIVWFSGKNEAGILKEEVQVNSLKQLNDLNNAIDRFLKPIGLTAFAKPLELVNDIIERISGNEPNGTFSLIFMSDGYNNDVPWQEVVEKINKISPKLSSSVIVEYGFYADSKRLTEMSSILGGEKINCDSFDEYDTVIANNFTKKLTSNKKNIIEIDDNHKYDFAYSVDSDGSILLYNIQDNKITIGSDINKIHYFSIKNEGDEDKDQHTALYAGIYVLADKILNDDAEKLFYALGDNYHYKMLINAFGKQKLNSFKSAVKECVIDINKRFPKGIETIKPISDNTYCLINLIEDLGGLNNCLFYPNHSDFNYNRIGRKKISRGSELSNDDKKRLSEATNIKEATKILDELNEKNIDIEFIKTNPNKGYPLTDLVWNEKRANLSVKIRIEGEVILPKNKYHIKKIDSFKYKTFTIIKDGILNIDKLPVLYSDELINILIKNNVKHVVDEEYNALTSGDNYGKTIIIDLSSLPIINRLMVKSISANDLAKQEWELKKIQGDKKVYDYYRKQLFPKESKSFIDRYGEECTNWLKEIGITDYNGFAPKSDFEESTDFYMSVNLITKIKGLSSLPKVDDVVAKLKDNKPLKLNEWVMSDAIIRFKQQQETDIYQSLSDEQKLGVLETYLKTKSEILNKKKRKIMQNIAQIKFSLILSKKWFTEFKSFNENQLTLKLDEHNIQFIFDLSEKEVKI